MEEVTLQAETDSLNQVLALVEKALEKKGCPMRVMMQIQMAVEEIYVNIARYAYHPGEGPVTIRISFEEEPLQAILTFIDHGIPYNPLEKDDPDVSLPTQKRPIGGLGIFMVKQLMDAIEYCHENGNNMLTVKKILQ